VISQLYQRYASEVEDIITSPRNETSTKHWEPNWWDDYPPRKSTASASSFHSRWATANRLLLRLLGWYSRLLPVSQGAQATPTGSLRSTTEVRDPHQPGEVLPSMWDHLPRL
jgi:hypothetical protein